ncbi:MAG: hypothetical protein COA78_22375 [Blastopirellula sp.]|nr:MAG: hypothetical protein COA78_22375 [Blastopirellula sp.]
MKYSFTTISLLSQYLMICWISLACAFVTSAEETPQELEFDYLQHPQDARLEEILQKKVLLDFYETPLDLVVKTLSKQFDLEIIINDKVLYEVGQDRTNPITFQTKFPVRFETVLTLILKQLDLSYRFDQGILEITTPEEIEVNHLYAKYYHLEPLLKYPLVSQERLMKYIKGLMSPESWWTLGGPGSIRPVHQGVVVTQHLQMHRKIALFLKSYHELVARLHAGDPSIPEVIEVPAKSDLVQQSRWVEIEDVSFIDTPLNEVMNTMAGLAQVSIYIDQRALADVGLRPNRKLSFQAKHGHTVKYVLSRMLRSLDLVVIEKEDLFIITTPEKQERDLEIRFYPLADFNLGTKSSHVVWMNMMVNCTDEEKWSRFGGPGDATLDPATMSLLAVQTGDVHGKVEDLIKQIRSSYRKHSTPTSPKIDLRMFPEITQNIIDVKRMYVYDLLDKGLSRRGYIKTTERYEEVRSILNNSLLIKAPSSIVFERGQMVLYATEATFDQLEQYLPQKKDGAKIRFSREAIHFVWCGPGHPSLLSEY